MVTVHVYFYGSDGFQAEITFDAKLDPDTPATRNTLQAALSDVWGDDFIVRIS